MENSYSKAERLYKEFVKEKGHEPSYALCKIMFWGEREGGLAAIKISEEAVFDEDNDIFYYCEGLSDLVDLMIGRSSDFYIEEVLAFTDNY